MKLLPKKELIPHIYILVATIIWAAAGPIIKITINYMPPITFLFLRFLIVGIVLLPYAWYALKKTSVNHKDYWNLFLLGVFSQTAILILVYALKYTTSLDTIIIGVLGSVLTVYAGHYFFREKISRNITIGLVMASLGSFIIMIEPILASINHIEVNIGQRIFGNFLAILSNVAWAIYMVWSKMTMGKESPILKKTLRFMHLKPMTKIYSPILIVTLTFYVGLLTMLPLMIIENILYPFNLLAIDPIGLLGLLYMAILSSIVAYVAYQQGLKGLKITETAIYGYLSPLLALPFAYILLREVPNTYMILGGIFIAIGVIIAEAKNS